MRRFSNASSAFVSLGYRICRPPRRETWGIALLFAAALALRLLVASKTNMISRDGLYYTALALMINTEQWLSTVGDWFLFNPYPALIALVARTGVSYDAAGQLVCAASAALAVLPLYAWCRSAFNRQVAFYAAFVYAVHPVLLRTSGQVYREGLYWLLMLWAVALLWEAVQRVSWWRFAVGGLLATAATLTRIEAAAVFVLAGLWWLWAPRTAGKTLWLKRGSGVALAAAMLPLTLVAVNLILIPRDHGWRGGDRLWYLGQRLLGTGPAASDPRDAARSPNAFDPAEAGPPRITDVRQLSKSLPVWDARGVPDLEQQRLYRFLVLADDHRSAIYLAKFASQCWQALQFPVLAWTALGLLWGMRSHGRRDRDVPLLLQALLLVGLFFYHLATEQILEGRYLFCLIPAVFPWAAIGIIESSRALRARLVGAGQLGRYRPVLAAACSVLLMASLGKAFFALESEKVPQRHLGECLRATYPRRLVIAGPEPLKRVGHYADSEYRIIPTGLHQPIAEWVDRQRVDFVVIAPDDSLRISPDELEQAPGNRFQRVLADDPRFSKIKIYQVLPPVRQLGS
jgi:hypothetical protein